MADQASALQRLLDENEIRALAVSYARCADGRDGEGFAGLFVEGGAILGEGAEFRGREAIARITKNLDATFDRTYHLVHNHHVAVDGDTATGQVYSQSHHLKKQDDGRTSDRIMTITYNDLYVRQDGAWRFQHRKLDVLWTQTHWIDESKKFKLNDAAR